MNNQAKELTKTARANNPFDSGGTNESQPAGAVMVESQAMATVQAIAIIKLTPVKNSASLRKS